MARAGRTIREHSSLCPLPLSRDSYQELPSYQLHGGEVAEFCLLAVDICCRAGIRHDNVTLPPAPAPERGSGRQEMHQASSADRAGLMRRSQDHGCSLAMSTATMSVTWPGRPGGPHSGPAPHIPPPAWRGSSVRNSISASRVVPKPRPTSSRGSRIEAIDLATTGDQNQSQQQRLVEGAFPGAPALAHHPVWRVSTVRASSARRSAPRDAGQGAPPGAQFSPPAPGILPAREGAASQPRGFKVRPRTSVAAPRPRGGDFLVVEGGGRGRRRADGEDSGRSLGGGWGCNAASQRTTTTATTTTTTKPEEEDSNGVVVTSARPPQEVAVRFRPFSSRDLGPGPKWGITDLTLQANNLVAVPHAVSQREHPPLRTWHPRGRQTRRELMSARRPTACAVCCSGRGQSSAVSARHANSAVALHLQSGDW